MIGRRTNAGVWTVPTLLFSLVTLLSNISALWPMGFTGVISSNLSACIAIRCSKPPTGLPIGSCWGGDSAHHWLLNLEPFWGPTWIVHAPCRPTILCLNQNICLQNVFLHYFLFVLSSPSAPWASACNYLKTQRWNWTCTSVKQHKVGQPLCVFHRNCLVFISPAKKKNR